MHFGELQALVAGSVAKATVTDAPGGSSTTLSTVATVTIPWPGSLAYSGDVAFAGVTASNMIVCSLAPHADTDENDADMLSIVGMSVLAGAAIATIKLAFSELTSGSIKLNLMAV